MISFIIPLSKNRSYLLSGCLYNLEKLYESIPYEILIIELDEHEPFKLGQVRNVGYKKSVGDIVVFIDVDIRIPNFIDFYGSLKTMGPFIAWNMISNVNEISPGVFEVLDRRKRLGHGGCLAFYRDQFEFSGGHSNLLIGWGFEDEILAMRWCFANWALGVRRPLLRLINDLYHVQHPIQQSAYGKDNEASKFNSEMCHTDMKRDRNKDSFIQTIWDDVSSIEYSPNVRHCQDNNQSCLSFP